MKQNKRKMKNEYGLGENGTQDLASVIGLFTGIEGETEHAT